MDQLREINFHCCCVYTNHTSGENLLYRSLTHDRILPVIVAGKNMLQPILNFWAGQNIFLAKWYLYVRVRAGTQAQKNARHIAIGAAWKRRTERNVASTARGEPFTWYVSPWSITIVYNSFARCDFCFGRKCGDDFYTLRTAVMVVIAIMYVASWGGKSYSIGLSTLPKSRCIIS